MKRAWPLIQACLMLLVCSACGDQEKIGPSTGEEGVGARVYWRRAEAETGWSAIHLRAERSCFLRFRVEGANDREHG
jgi:hypothetical protein